jgi:magnesium chelatase family protein
MDRVDLRVHMHREPAEAFAAEEGESTALVRERVKSAREAAAQRWEQHGIRTNAEVSGVQLRRRYRPEPEAMAPLKTAVDRGLLSIGGVDRTLRVTWPLTHACPSAAQRRLRICQLGGANAAAMRASSDLRS